MRAWEVHIILIVPLDWASIFWPIAILSFVLAQLHEKTIYQSTILPVVKMKNQLSAVVCKISIVIKNRRKITIFLNPKSQAYNRSNTQIHLTIVYIFSIKQVLTSRKDLLFHQPTC